MNIAICDDERAYCDTIKELIDPYTVKQKHIKCQIFYSGEDLLNYCHDHPVFDIAFLDIELLEINGLDVAKKLLSLNEECIIIFITNHVSYVSDTFRLKTFQFLIKPIDPHVFRQDFERALKKYNILHTHYSIRWRNKQTSIPYKDILFIEVYGKHLLIHTVQQKYECVGRLSEEEIRLNDFHFVRCHRSYLVNLAYIKTIEKDSVVLFNNQQLLLSRQMRKKVFEAFNMYLTGHAI